MAIPQMTRTALNSIAPYLPELVANLPDVPEADVGFYVGMLASAFALAQLSSNFAWGYASDVIGRKPVLVAGTFCLMLCFLAFGFCQRYWQVVLVHALMGLLNGNAAAVPTVLGEVTDRSNQSKVFAYLPIVYSLGSITGPAAGGVLAGRLSSRYTYLAPNLFAAVLLATSVNVVAIWFQETLNADETAPEVPRWAKKLSAAVSRAIGFVGSLFRPCRGRAPPHNRSWSSRWPRPQSASGPRQALLSSAASDTSSDDEEDESPSDEAGEVDDKQGKVWREILNHTTILLLLTYLLFQLANISFNSLYPIFAAAPAPEGRELDPDQIGVALSLSGIATMFFQGIVFQPLKARRGNLGTYRLALFGLAVSMFLIPWIGYLSGTPPFGLATAKVWLFGELGLILIIKNVSAVAGLSSVMLLLPRLQAWGR
ncbi:putative membrane protein [Escovopsis weberi]|uniref:Putative membrane protein n=1 Tax=Escovopsis weberi TaxID=150374 RepID=A0A0M9VRM6_ESCWE|nr:putative membrane protein [Escovopsis weberi]